MTTVLTIQASDLVRNLKAMLCACSPDETRAHLNSILIEVHEDKSGYRTAAQTADVEPGIVRMVATNGHWLLVNDMNVTVGYWGVRHFQISMADAKKLIKAVSTKQTSKFKSGPVILTFEDVKCKAEQHGLTIAEWNNVEAKFPPYAQVIPDMTGGRRAPTGKEKAWNADLFPSISAPLMGEVCAAFTALVDNKRGSIGLDWEPSGGYLDPIVVSSESLGAGTAVAVVMPMRMGESKLGANKANRFKTTQLPADGDKAAE